MKTSEKGLLLIKHYEGMCLRAYQCAAGVWTIGYGHTECVSPEDIISPEQADIFLRQDITVSEAAVMQFVRVPLRQNQFDALVSFVFNLGAGNFASSTLLKRLNDGNYCDAAKEFPRWIHAGGKKLTGLIKRREAEKNLFLLNDNDNRSAD